jgi:hypothetical protein
MSRIDAELLFDVLCNLIAVVSHSQTLRRATPMTESAGRTGRWSRQRNARGHAELATVTGRVTFALLDFPPWPNLWRNFTLLPVRCLDPIPQDLL